MAGGGSDGSLRFDTRVDTTGFEQGVSTLSSAARTLQADMERAGSTIERSFGSSSKITNLNNQIEQTEAKIQRLTAEMAEIGQSQIPTDEYRWYQEQIDATSSKLEALMARQEKMDAMGVSHNSSRWKTLQYDIEQTTRQLEVYRNEMEILKSDGEAFTSGADSAAYTDRANRVQQLTSQLEVYRQRLAETEERERTVGTPLKSFGATAQAAFNRATSAALKFARSIGSKMASQIRSFVANTKKINGASNGVSKSILKLSNMFKMLLLRMAMRAVIQGVREGFQNLVQYSSEANATLSGLMSSMGYLKNSFAAAFAPILTAVAPALNTLISLLATALNYINQFFSALGGKTTFIRAKKTNEDYAKSLKGTGGAAKKAGQEAKKALAPFDDLVQIQLNANKGSGGGGGGGGGAVSPANMFETAEINKGISDFAKQLKDLFNAGDFAGIGKLIGEKINDAVGMFTKFISWDNLGGKITEFVTAFTTMFNSLVATIDWNAIGVMIGTGVNTILHTLYLLLTQIDWYALGKALGDGLNGMVSTIDWELFGATLGEYFKAKVEGLRGFVETVDWDSIGEAVSQSLNSMMEHIPWENLGLVAAESLNGVFRAFHTAVENFEWATLGENIGTSLTTIFNTFDFGMVAESIGMFVMGLLDTLIKIVQTTDWSKLAVGIETMLTSIDWLGIASRLYTLFYSAVGTVFGMLARVVADLIIKGFTKARDYFGKEIEDCGGNVVQGLLNGVKNALIGIAGWVYKNMIKPFIDGVKNGFGIHSPSKVMEEIGTYLWEGFCNGVKNTFSAPINFIKQNITDPFVNGVKGLLGIHSPSTIMQEVGGFTVEGFNQGVSQKQVSTQSIIQSWASGVSSWFATKLGINSNTSSEAQKWASGTITGFNTGVTSNYKTTQNVIEAWSKAVRTWFIGAGSDKGVNKESWTKFALDIITAFKDKILGSNTDTQSPVELWAQNIRKWFVDESEAKGINAKSWTKFAQDIITAFKTKIESSHTETKTPMQTWGKNVTEWFWGDGNTSGSGGLYQSFYNMAKRINEGFAKGINEFGHMAKSAVRKWAREAVEEAEKVFKIHSPSREFRSIAEYVVKGFNAGIADTAKTSISEAQKWLSGVIDVFDGVDIGVPIGLDIPNASSYIPNVAKGKITPTGTGYVDTLKASYENKDDVLGMLADKMQASNGSTEPSQIVIKFDSSLGALARLLKPELDKEAKRKGVSLVLVGGN